MMGLELGRTAVTPMGRLGKPAELNGLAVFLASDASGFMTGSNVMCDVSIDCCWPPTIC